MKFSKMQGLGNDFAFVNAMEYSVNGPHDLARRVCDQHFGVGAEGLILVLPSRTADFRMRYFNSDGSEGEMCGNGPRCFAKYVFEKELTQKMTLDVETLAGKMYAQLAVIDGSVTAVTTQIGRPLWKRREVPALGGDPDSTMLDELIPLPNGTKVHLTALRMGPPL